MTPALSAILDRFILDTANTKFVAFSMPPDAFDRPVPGIELSVGQLFDHLAGEMESQAKALTELSPSAVPSEPGAHSGNSVEDGRPATRPPLTNVVERIDRALNSLVRTASALDDGRLDATLIGGTTALQSLFEWSHHFANHGLDFADALPELRLDPMMLNWLLYADFDDDAGRLARQRQLLIELREKYPDDDDDDHGL